MCVCVCSALCLLGGEVEASRAYAEREAHFAGDRVSVSCQFGSELQGRSVNLTLHARCSTVAVCDVVL